MACAITSLTVFRLRRLYMLRSGFLLLKARQSQIGTVSGVLDRRSLFRFLVLLAQGKRELQILEASRRKCGYIMRPVVVYQGHTLKSVKYCRNRNASFSPSQA